MALSEMAFSAVGTSTRKRTGRLRAMIVCARPSTIAAPPISFFIISMAEDGLISARRYRRSPLADKGDRRTALAPAHIDEPWRAFRSAADCIDRRKITGEVFSDGDIDARAEVLCQFPCRILHALRRQMIGRVLIKSRPRQTPAAIASMRCRRATSATTSCGLGAGLALGLNRSNLY